MAGPKTLDLNRVDGLAKEAGNETHTEVVRLVWLPVHPGGAVGRSKHNRSKVLPKRTGEELASHAEVVSRRRPLSARAPLPRPDSRRAVLSLLTLQFA